jgi:hypothetical protein
MNFRSGGKDRIEHCLNVKVSCATSPNAAGRRDVKIINFGVLTTTDHPTCEPRVP